MSPLLWAVVVLCCAALLLLAHRRSRRRARFWSSRGFPAVDSSQLLGSFFANLRRPKALREVDEALYREVKGRMRAPYAGFSFMGQQQLIVTDLELAKRVFVKDADHFLGRLQAQMSAMKDTDPLFAQMLFFMEGDEWKELRAKMSPTFTTSKIKRMFHVFEASSRKMVDYLVAKAKGSPTGSVELLEVNGRYTMDVIASAAFGIDAKTFAEEDPVFSRMGRKFNFDPSLKFILVFMIMTIAPKLAAALKLGLLDKEMQAFFSHAMQSAITHRETTGDRRGDFLQLMLDARSGQLKHEEGDEGEVEASKGGGFELTDAVLVAQGVSFILAGFDTSQTLLVFAIYELALNPHMQERLREEVEESWARSGRLSYEAVNQLEYIDKVVNETLRKYPPVVRLERRTMHDYTIPDTDLVIPKGAQVVIPTYCIHRDEKHFPEPDKFDPERFSAEARAARHPYAFQPFGHGPRNCLGMRFALTSAKTAIATLVRHFSFEPCAETRIPMEFEKGPFLKPKDGVRLKVTRRHVAEDAQKIP